MPYLLTMPARINLLGNPSDANEGDYAVLSAAVELRAAAQMEEAGDLQFEMLSRSPGGQGAPAQPVTCQHFALGQFPLPYSGPLDLLLAATNRLYAYSQEFRQKVHQRGFHLQAGSNVPRQSGLGGSSLFVLLTLAALRLHYQLDEQIHNDYVLSELAQRAEALELGIACGYADRYVPLFGGLAYVDYRGKLQQRPLQEEPYATYERLPLNTSLPLVAISTGIQHDSGDVHGQMRPRYLEEQAYWEANGGEPPPLVHWMQAAWQTAWKGKIALLEGNLQKFGYLMNENHRLVNEMMAYCGFPDGAGWANNLFVQAALENGAYGAKLTGAGSGGSVFALVQAGQEAQIEQAWQELARQQGLQAAWIYRPRVARRGLTIRSIGQVPFQCKA